MARMSGAVVVAAELTVQVTRATTDKVMLAFLALSGSLTPAALLTHFEKSFVNETNKEFSSTAGHSLGTAMEEVLRGASMRADPAIAAPGASSATQVVQLAAIAADASSQSTLSSQGDARSPGASQPPFRSCLGVLSRPCGSARTIPTPTRAA